MAEDDGTQASGPDDNARLETLADRLRKIKGQILLAGVQDKTGPTAIGESLAIYVQKVVLESGLQETDAEKLSAADTLSGNARTSAVLAALSADTTMTESQIIALASAYVAADEMPKDITKGKEDTMVRALETFLMDGPQTIDPTLKLRIEAAIATVDTQKNHDLNNAEFEAARTPIDDKLAADMKADIATLARLKVKLDKAKEEARDKPEKLEKVQAANKKAWDKEHDRICNSHEANKDAWNALYKLEFEDACKAADKMDAPTRVAASVADNKGWWIGITAALTAAFAFLIPNKEVPKTNSDGTPSDEKKADGTPATDKKWGFAKVISVAIPAAFLVGVVANFVPGPTNKWVDKIVERRTADAAAKAMGSATSLG